MKPALTPEEARRDHRDMLMFMARNCAIGVLAGLVISGAIFYFDVGNLWTHTARSSDKFTPIFLLTFPMCMLLGGAALGSALMLMPYEKKYHSDE